MSRPKFRNAMEIQSFIDNLSRVYHQDSAIKLQGVFDLRLTPMERKILADSNRRADVVEISREFLLDTNPDRIGKKHKSWPRFNSAEEFDSFIINFGRIEGARGCYSIQLTPEEGQMLTHKQGSAVGAVEIRRGLAMFYNVKEK